MSDSVECTCLNRTVAIVALRGSFKGDSEKYTDKARTVIVAWKDKRPGDSMEYTLEDANTDLRET